MQIYIYGLIDPIKNQIRYIGKTNDVKVRFKNHLNACRDKNTHKRNWINTLNRSGRKPELLIIDTVLVDDWKYWEIFWIAYYKSIGADLLNYTIGGDGLTFGNQTSFKTGHNPWNTGIPRSKKTKDKIRKSLTGIPTGRVRKIIQYDLNNNIIARYNSMSDAAKLTNSQMSKISDCCNGKRKHHNKFIWNYDNEKN